MASLFVQSLSQQCSSVASKLTKQNAADSKRKSLPKSNVRAPTPPPQLTEEELKRQASIEWFRTKELPKVSHELSREILVESAFCSLTRCPLHAWPTTTII